MHCRLASLIYIGIRRRGHVSYTPIKREFSDDAAILVKPGCDIGHSFTTLYSSFNDIFQTFISSNMIAINRILPIVQGIRLSLWFPNSGLRFPDNSPRQYLGL